MVRAGHADVGRALDVMLPAHVATFRNLGGCAKRAREYRMPNGAHLRAYCKVTTTCATRMAHAKRTTRLEYTEKVSTRAPCHIHESRAPHPGQSLQPLESGPERSVRECAGACAREALRCDGHLQHHCPRRSLTLIVPILLQPSPELWLCNACSTLNSPTRSNR